MIVCRVYISLKIYEPKPLLGVQEKFVAVNRGDWGGWGRRGGMNCGNLGEGSGDRDFP